MLIALLALGGCGDDEDTPGTTTGGSAAATATATATATSAPAEEAGCEGVEEPEPKGLGDLSKPKAELDADKTYVAVVDTSCGTFEITLAAEESPKTGGSFVYLAKEGFFDDTTFHRVVPGFVIQGGDPEGNSTGGPGYQVVEPPPDDTIYSRGVVAMAKSETDPRGASGSQFFVVTGEDAALPPDFALLGEVTEGIEVVERIGIVAIDAADRPVSPVVIESVEIREN